MFFKPKFSMRFYASCATFCLLGVTAPAQAQLLTGYQAEEEAAVNAPAPIEVSAPPVATNVTPKQPSDSSFAPLTWGHEATGETEPATKVAAIGTKHGQEITDEPVPFIPPDDFKPFLTTQDAQPIPVESGQSGSTAQTAARNETDDEAEPVDLQADDLQHNQDTQIITATGNVILTQAGRVLRADRVDYNLNTDQAEARGNVVLEDINGDVHRAEYVRLEDNLRDGFVESLRTMLQDGSRFRARDGKREDAIKTTMFDAIYTPCEPCKNDPDAAPIWQIRASEAVRDEEAKRIHYENVRFETFGIPIAYFPYFSHSDGTEERKSGFLPPSFVFNSQLGVGAGSEYYWSIAEDKDATVGLTVVTDELPIVTGQYRQRWQDAGFEFNGSLTSSERVGLSGGETVTLDEEVRGHVFSRALWEINDQWRAGLDVQWASDDQYLRQYDISNEDVLESQIFAERFSGRDYGAIRFLAFQDVRVREEQEDQPQVLPEIVANFKGEPDSVPIVGGTWRLDASTLGLRRSGDAEQDVNRASLEAGWDKRLVSDYGLVTDIAASARADYYNTRDRADTAPGEDDSSNENRFFTNLHVESSYPVAKNFTNSQLVLEPVAALTLTPNIDVNDDIPNEDSQDVQIDVSNIFEPNRFPGLDLVEDQSRVTYGLRAGLYGHEGSFINGFLGQSYRFDDDDTPFPAGSGLDQQESDIVGQLGALYDNRIGLNYRFQLDSQDASSVRQEVGAFAGWDRLRLSARYLFAEALEGTDIDESREQLTGSAAYFLSEEWRVRAAARQDLGEDPGLRRAAFGIDYLGQCVSLSLTGVRNLTDDLSGESDTEILFSIGLKNISEFQESSLRQRREREYSDSLE